MCFLCVLCVCVVNVIDLPQQREEMIGVGLALPEISNYRQNHLANFTAINKSQSRRNNGHADTERIEELHNDVSIGHPL